MSTLMKMEICLLFFLLERGVFSARLFDLFCIAAFWSFWFVCFWESSAFPLGVERDGMDRLFILPCPSFAIRVIGIVRFVCM
jgi:hypothetical protein